MESRGAAVLSLGQHLAPFGELPQQEAAAAAASGPPWRGGGREEEGDTKATASRSRATAPEPQAGVGADGEEQRWELRRRLGRSFSLPASPSLAAARLFSGHDRDGEEEEEEGAPSGGLGCCTKCKKRVQFADALGLCLASVKHFSAADEPQVPPAVLSRLQSFPLGQKDLVEFSAALAGLGGCAPSPLAPRSGQQLKPEPLLVASWPDGADAERLRAQRVFLEEVAGTAVAGVPLDVRGVVRVLSCPGPKEVVVRYTFNEWLSFLDAPAVALADASEPSSCPVERYQFSLCLPPGLPEGAAVHFALCYRSQLGEYWDNNGGANYTLRGGSSPEKPSSPFY